MRFAVACVVIIIAVAIGATHKNEVKAAWNKMTSLISRILGSTEDADDYVKQIQKTMVGFLNNFRYSIHINLQKINTP